MAPLPRSRPAPAGLAVALIAAAPGWSQTTFAPATPIATVGSAPAWIAADLDRDGDLDLAGTSAAGLLWLANAGAGSGWSSAPVAASEPGLDRIAAGDLDGDGDRDLAVAADALSWYANDGDAASWTPMPIALAGGFAELALADLDRDGDLDLATASTVTGQLEWWQNAGGAFVAQPIAARTGVGALATADLDRDGTSDLALVSDAGLERLANVAGDGSTFAALTVDAATPATASLAVVDVERDGDLDLATGTAGGMSLHLDVAGDGSAWSTAPVAAAGGTGDLHAADLDRDGDGDLVGSSASWHEHVDGAGGFTARGLGAALDQRLVADLDGDGAPDLVELLAGALAWRTNELTPEPASTYVDRALVTTAADFTIGMAAADVDGDGDVDAISSAFLGDEIAWHANVDGQGRVWSTTVVSTVADGANSVIAADVDGDGDLDLASTSRFDDRVAWYENLDSVGTSWATHDVSTTSNGARSVVAGDVDGDGDTDFAVSSKLSGRITWHENLAGDGSAFATHVVSGSAIGTGSVVVGDLDGDGDLDIVSAAADVNLVQWHENDALTFSDRTIDGDSPAASELAIADLDGDGDLDVLSASYLSSEIAWHRNEAGASAWTKLPVANPGLGSPSGAISVDAADVDLDGDVDVLAAWIDDDGITVHPNLVGDGSSWGLVTVTSSADGSHFVVAADVDGDGRPEPLSASRADDTIAWYPARSLVTRTSAVSLTSGASQASTLHAGADRAGDFAWILGSVTGTSPGFAVDGVHVPLQPDAWFQFTLAKPFSGVFSGFLSFLDAAGTGGAAFTIPAGLDPSLAGLTFHHAFVSATVLGDVDFASDPIALELLP